MLNAANEKLNDFTKNLNAASKNPNVANKVQQKSYSVLLSANVKLKKRSGA